MHALDSTRPPGGGRRRPPGEFRLVAGTLAASLGIGASRWGSYLGYAPLFLTDVLLAAATVHFAVIRLGLPTRRPGGGLDGGLGGGPGNRWRDRAGEAGSGRPRSGPVPVWELLVALFAGYVLARFAGGGNHSMAALRDLTPYAYSAVALLAGRAYLAAGRRPRAATGRFLSAVTLLHLSWVALVVLIPAIPTVTPALPGSHGLTIFTLRPDFDGAVLGLTAGLRLVRFLRGGRAVNGLIVLVCLGLSASMPSRAGVLAALAAAVTAVALTMCARPATATGAETAAGAETTAGIGTAAAAAATTEIGTGDPGGRGQRRRLTAVTLLLVAVAALGMVAPMTTAGSKLLAGFGLQPPSNTLDSAGIGTTHARETAWHAVLGYVDETHSRALGVGFGVNIVNAAGATSALSGSLLVRSPHNYLVGLYARTGLVGVALFLGIVVAAIGAVLTLRRDIADDSLLLAATLAPAAILTSAMMGVVLESPFGAVPFFWSVGVLLGARAERVAQRAAAPATLASVTRASVTPVAVTPGATPAPVPLVRAVAGVPLRQ